MDKLTQGLEELGKFVDDGVSTSTYEHIYRTNFSGTYKQHACLLRGYWCWKNAREDPIATVKFLLARERRSD